MPSSSLFLRSSTTLFSALSLFSSSIAAASGKIYANTNSYTGTDFYDQFDYWTTADPNRGFVTYVDQNTAQNAGLVRIDSNSFYMSVDAQNVYDPNSPYYGNNGYGRPSVRLTSKSSWDKGLFVLDLAHMPGGVCGVWPAFWTLGADGNWPTSGEIDIVEGVNNRQFSLAALHTGGQSVIDSDASAMTGSIQATDCRYDVATGANSVGCSIFDQDTSAYGTGLNNNGGGIVAMEWTDDVIQIWHFSRGSAPSDINSASPDPSKWGLPVQRFSGNSANIKGNFDSQKITINTNFCGDFGNAVWQSEGCAAQTGYDTCAGFVANNPSAFTDQYWAINSLKIYALNDAPVTTTSSTTSSISSSTTTTSTTSSSSSTATTSTSTTDTTLSSVSTSSSSSVISSTTSSISSSSATSTATTSAGATTSSGSTATSTSGSGTISSTSSTTASTSVSTGTSSSLSSTTATATTSSTTETTADPSTSHTTGTFSSGTTSSHSTLSGVPTASFDHTSDVTVSSTTSSSPSTSSSSSTTLSWTGSAVIISATGTPGFAMGGSAKGAQSWSAWTNVPTPSFITTTITTTYVVPCSTGLETSTASIVTSYAGGKPVTYTPKATFTTYTTTCPAEWGFGGPVTVTVPITTTRTIITTKTPNAGSGFGSGSGNDNNSGWGPGSGNSGNGSGGSSNNNDNNNSSGNNVPSGSNSASAAASGSPNANVNSQTYSTDPSNSAWQTWTLSPSTSSVTIPATFTTFNVPSATPDATYKVTYDAGAPGNGASVTGSSYIEAATASVGWNSWSDNGDGNGVADPIAKYTGGASRVGGGVVGWVVAGVVGLGVVMV